MVKFFNLNLKNSLNMTIMKLSLFYKYANSQQHSKINKKKLY